MIRTTMFSRLVALLFALLLTGFPVAAVAQRAHQDKSRGATTLQSDLLDLPAMTLLPADLDEAGLEGLGLTYGGVDTLDYAAGTYAEIRGGATPDKAAEYAQLLRDAGWQLAYENYFASPSPDDPNEFSQRLRSVVTQYADDDGAAKAFAVLTDGDEITAFTVEEIPWDGDKPRADEAVLWRYDSTRKATGAPYHALELDLRLGNLTASLTLDDFGSRKPVIAAVEVLVTALLRRIETTQANGEPGLSASALRFALPTDTASYDNYVRLDGEEVRYYGESPEHAKDRLAIYPDVPDIYVVYQTIGYGEPDEADDITFRSYIHQFDTESSASTWLNEVAHELNPLQGAPSFGDESHSFPVVCGCADEAGPHGFGILVRVGTMVAVYQLIATWDISRAAFVDVAQAQTDCLANAGCLQPSPIPGSLVPMTGRDQRAADANTGPITDRLFPDTNMPEESSR